MNLKETIEFALKEHDEYAMQCAAYKTPESKAFIIKQVHWVVDHLLELSQEIRGNVAICKWEHGRVPHNVMNELLTIGQSLTSFLFLANLRNKITDPIEYTYGISFSSLKVCQQVTDKNDGKPVFIFYNPHNFPGHIRRDSSYTLAKDGELFFVSLAEFDSNYSA